MVLNVLNHWGGKRLRIDIEAAQAHSAPVSPALNSSCIDLEWNEEEARSIKKKKDNEKPLGDAQAEKPSGSSMLSMTIRKAIKKLDNEIRALAMAARERNTRKEIKEASMNARCYISQIMTAEAQELLQQLGRKVKGGLDTTEVGTSGVETQTVVRESNGELEALRSSNRNLILENARLTEEIRRLKLSKRIVRPDPETVTEEQLNGVKTYEDLKAIRNKRWPEKRYKAAFMAVGNPLKANKDADLVALCDSAPGLANICSPVMESMFAARFPEFEDLEDKIDSMTITTKRLSEGQQKETKRWVTRVEINDDSEDLFNTLCALRDRLVMGNRKKVALYPTHTDPDGRNMRQILECVFRSTEIKCLIFIQKGYGMPKNRNEPERAKRDTVALVVREEGKSYAELLKMAKEKILPGSNAAKGIRTIREGRSGQMVVVVDKKEQECLNELRGQLRVSEKAVVSTGKQSSNELAISIKEIDAVTTREGHNGAIKGNGY